MFVKSSCARFSFAKPTFPIFFPLNFQVIKKEDGAYTVQSAVTFDSAHTDNGDVVGKTFEFKTLN